MRPHAAFLAAFLLSWPALTQQTPCGQRDDILSRLWANAKETVVHRALAHNGFLLEILTSETGTYTAIATNPANKQTCMVSVGTGWHDVPSRPKGNPS